MEEIFNIENQIKQEPFLEGQAETNEKTYERLRGMVEECYSKHNVDGELIRQFVTHNKQVEEFVVDFSKKEKFDIRQREVAILSAILHDITKGWRDFLNHGDEGGKIAEEILKEVGTSEKLAESVKFAIERHMGQEGYPADIAKQERGNDFKYPKYKTIVGQLVYECDILTQLTEEGIEKILLIREKDEKNIEEDRALAKRDGISVEEARIKSVLESARKSFGLIEIDSIKKRAIEFWEEIEKEYRYAKTLK